MDALPAHSRTTGSSTEPDAIAAALARLRPHLERLAATDPQARCDLELLGRWLTSMATVADAAPMPAPSSPSPTTTETPRPPTTDSRNGATRDDQRPTGSPSFRPSPARVSGPRVVGFEQGPPAAAVDALPAAAPVPLRLGDAAATVSVRGAPHELDAAASAASRATEPQTRPGPAGRDQPEAPLPDLGLIARRCRVKAECCRWAIRRRQLVASHADWNTHVRPGDQRHAALASGLPRCKTWPLDPFATLPADETLESIARTYEGVAAAADVVDRLAAAPPAVASALREEAYQLLAEAQSALRRVMEEGGLEVDLDQDESFRWLRTRTRLDEVFVRRHMRWDDAADPAQVADLPSRAAALAQRLAPERDAPREPVRERRNLLNKLRYLAERSGTWPEEERARRWASFAAAVEAFAEGGGRTSDPELRAVLLEVVDDLPEELVLGRAFADALRHLDAFLARREAEDPAPPPRPSAFAPEVAEVARLLRGTVMVIIGGERRRQAEAALREAFDLAEVRWIGTIDHQSIAPFEAAVARPEVAIVLVPIRFSNHSFEGIQDFCRTHGKPFVRLPAGYGANRVALEIVRQAGETLRRG